MDARTGVERQLPAMPEWIVSGKSQSPMGGAVAVDEPATAWPIPHAAAQGQASRLSVDPLRATDRYRLVMPYVEHV